MDEIIFSGKYKDWKYSVRFELDNANARDVAYALAYIHEHVECEAFYNSGVDCIMLEKQIPFGNGIQDLITFLESKKPGEWKELLLKAAKKEELLPVAEAKFISTLLSKNKVFAKITTAIVESRLKPKEQELLEGQISFIGHYKDWISIKKMSVDEKTQDYEVAGILSSINSTLVNKSFDFMGVDKSVDAIATNATKGKRKSFINLAEALKKVVPSLTGEKIQDAYILKLVFENLGFAPYATVDLLMPAYPDLKIPKPKGRFAKK